MACCARQPITKADLYAFNPDFETSPANFTGEEVRDAVANLVAFEAALQESEANPKTPAQMIELIDIGGVALLRAAAKNFAYVMNEQGTSMSAYAFDASQGTLTEIETEESLPASVTTPSTGADVHVHPNGKFVYGSNRSGADSTLVIYSIDPNSGAFGKVTSKSNDSRNIQMSLRYHF